MALKGKNFFFGWGISIAGRKKDILPEEELLGYVEFELKVVKIITE